MLLAQLYHSGINKASQLFMSCFIYCHPFDDTINNSSNKNSLIASIVSLATLVSTGVAFLFLLIDYLIKLNEKNY